MNRVPVAFRGIDAAYCLPGIEGIHEKGGVKEAKAAHAEQDGTRALIQVLSPISNIAPLERDCKTFGVTPDHGRCIDDQ